jgi:hypothetical protein
MLEAAPQLSGGARPDATQIAIESDRFHRVLLLRKDLLQIIKPLELEGVSTRIKKEHRALLA